MEIGKATSVYQTQEVKGTKRLIIKKHKKLIIKHSADDLMQIPFEEAKEIKSRMDR